HQTSFQLQFNETFSYESGTNIHQILKTREVFNLEQLNFEYSQIYDGDNDQAMISEAFTYGLYRQAGLVVANASYGLVYLKIGDTVVPYGFFTVVEPIDSEFLKANFKSNLANEYGDLYKITDVMTEGSLKTFDENLVGLDSDEARYTYSLRNNSLDGTRRTFSTLESFINHINDPVYFNDHSQDILDVDLFIRYLAIAFLAGNTDDLRYNFNNYYLYFDVYSRQATFIPFDLDASLGFGKHLDLSGNYGVSYAIDYNLDDPSPLIASIFANETYVNLYRHYLQTFIEDFFNYDDFYLMYLEAKNLYEPLLISQGHLGNRVFDTRNVYWYFTEKTTSVLNQLQ
ncbi:MAG TPA: CotH kinase family protein, partial [Bacillota bacterium]|nr:CotH kinase family protein [Bacillota bacterium]